MIESFPSILGYSFENIDAKIELLSKINKIYNLNINPISIIESNLSILGVKFEKLIVIIRVLSDYQPKQIDIQRKITTLSQINIESLLISYSQRKTDSTIDDLTREARKVKKQKISKEDKRKLIKDFFDKNPESYKIYRDYLKGYPEKSVN